MSAIAENWHGTFHGYNKQKCRCELCRASARAYKQEYLAGRGREVMRAYNRARDRNLEAENLRRKELRARVIHNEAPITTMPFYKFLAELGQPF